MMRTAHPRLSHQTTFSSFTEAVAISRAMAKANTDEVWATVTERPRVKASFTVPWVPMRKAPATAFPWPGWRAW